MKRVLTARFMHETNTFSRVRTDLAAFRRRDHHPVAEVQFVQREQVPPPPVPLAAIEVGSQPVHAFLAVGVRYQR